MKGSGPDKSLDHAITLASVGSTGVCLTALPTLDEPNVTSAVGQLTRQKIYPKKSQKRQRTGVSVAFGR